MAGQTFAFPFSPYPVQQELMSQMYDVMDAGGVGIFESPTGTGKSLSVICSSLKWRADAEATRKSRMKVPESSGNSGDSSAADEPDWLRSWDADQKQKLTSSALTRLDEAQSRLEARLQAARLEKVDNRKANAKKRARVTKSSLKVAPYPTDEPSSEVLVEDYYSDPEERARNSHRRCISSSSDESDDEVTIGSASMDPEKLREEDTKHLTENIPKVFYCSRTHSQLAQFVREIKKTAFKDVRVVSLGSRRNLCINPTVKALSSESRINDACLDLQQQKSKTSSASVERTADGKRTRKGSKSSKGCPFLGSQSSQRYLADRILAKAYDLKFFFITDIEELVGFAASHETCSYYASREALALAELVVMPYTSLLHQATRESLGVSLKGSVVILDEAHNIVETMNSIYSARLSSSQVSTAQTVLSAYLERYRSRLKGKNILYINQIRNVLKALSRFFQRRDAAGSGPLGASSSGKPSDTAHKSVYTINELLFELGLDNLNMLKLERYLESSGLPRKLLGFTRLAHGSEGLRAVDPVHDQSTHISPLSLVHRFVMCLSHSDSDGRIVIEKVQISGPVHTLGLKFMMLNPAVHFTSIVEEAQAVVLVGGTMQPFDYIGQQLLQLRTPHRSLPASVHTSSTSSSSSFADFQTPFFQTYACGHVIPPENVLPIALGKGPTGVEFDFTFRSRHDSGQIDELGRLICNLCHVCPKGVVCFFPSYDYEQEVVSSWTKNGTIARIQTKKTIFREPRITSELESTLQSYSRAVTESPSGAIIFCVVGAKMSEGINFSDDMARCVVVVGLPYPDRSDPELAQKMSYLDQQKGAHLVNVTSPGQEYYENLCMRAVNQSIGRSIRHIADYSAIILVDKRYISKRSITQKLPRWIADRIQHIDSFGAAVRQLRLFYAAREQSTREPNE